MDTGISIEVVETDPDYMGIAIRVWTERFCGSTFIFAGFDELSRFADAIAGFPSDMADHFRSFEFGRLRGMRFAGGYCRFDMAYLRPAQGAAAHVYIQDDVQRFSEATAGLVVPVEAAALDRFVAALKQVERDRAGKAVLSTSD